MINTAKAAVRAAGEIQRKNSNKILKVDMEKKNDIKLEVDRLCEEAIINTIIQTHPQDCFLAEEGGLSGNLEGENVWIVDPLDGTVNYYYGLPYFCSSVACYRRKNRGKLCADIYDLGEPVCGAVYAAMTDEMFSAEKGQGAFLNGEEISVSNARSLDKCIVATGYGSTRNGIERMFNGSAAIAESVRKLRCLGAAAYDICNVAAGRLGGFFEKGLHSWDIAAAGIIAREAGADIKAVEYEECRWDVVVSAPGVSGELNALMERGS